MLTCKLNKVDTTQQIILKTDGYVVSFYDTIDELSTSWNPNSGSNLFLNSAFLKALEVAPPSGTQYRYGVVSRGETTIGIVYFQIKRINLYLSLRLDAYEPKGFADNVWHKVKSFLAKQINQHVLVNGNMTLTGNNGFLFDQSIDNDLIFTLIDDLSERLICQLKTEKIKIRAVLLKDFRESEKPVAPQWSFSEFQVQPNMILSIDKDWQSFDDYMAAMKSKYRVRVRRARKKAASLDKRILSLEEIYAHADDISRLYKNVANQAGFNLFILPKNYFYSLQKHLGDNMKLVGYFDEGRMVGYYTHIFNNNELDAHFLGYDPDCNQNCQLYLNMLYDLVEDAIEMKAHNLILSRTAMEIKSSIGAVSHEMYLYLKTTNGLFNRGVSAALNYFKPKADWKPRSPFK